MHAILSHLLLTIVTTSSGRAMAVTIDRTRKGYSAPRACIILLLAAIAAGWQ